MLVPASLTLPLSLSLLLLAPSISGAVAPPSRYCTSQVFRSLWAPPHYKIFATDSSMRREPGETLALMRELLACYEKSGCLEEDPRNDGGARRRADILRQLVAAAELTSQPVDCNEGALWRKLANLNRLIDRHQPFRVNVVPLLEASRSWLLESCAENLQQQLMTLFRTKAERNKEALDEEFIDWAHEKLPQNYDQPKLVSWLLALIELHFDRQHASMTSPGLFSSSFKPASRLLSSESGAKKPAPISIHQLEEAFDRFESRSCLVFKRDLEPELRQTFRLTESDDIRLLQSLTKDLSLQRWLQYSQVCLDLGRRSAPLKSRLVLAGLLSDRKLRSL